MSCYLNSPSQPQIRFPHTVVIYVFITGIDSMEPTAFGWVRIVGQVTRFKIARMTRPALNSGYLDDRHNDLPYVTIATRVSTLAPVLIGT